MVLTTVLPSFQTSWNLRSPRISTWSCFSFFCSSGGSSFGGPGTRASALMRAICDQTAVTSRNATRHSKKSMNGISGISWFDGTSCRRAATRRQYQPWLSSSMFSEAFETSGAGRPRDGAPGAMRARASGSLLETLEVDLLAVGDDEVQHLHGRLVDVVLDAAASCR